MKVTFLGSGTSTGVPVPTCDCAVCRSDDSRDSRLRPSIVMEWNGVSILVDTSTDLRQQALRHRLARVDAVLYTHPHADHILGVDELRLYNWRQRGPVVVYGSRRTLDALKRTFWYVFDPDETAGTRPMLDPRTIEAPFELHGVNVVPVPVLHGQYEIFGYRVGRFAYLTDVSAIPEASYPLLEGLDVLVISALRPRPHPMHLSLEQSLNEASKIAANRTLLTHMSHEMPHREISGTLPETVELAYDGLVVEVAHA